MTPFLSVEIFLRMLLFLYFRKPIVIQSPPLFAFCKSRLAYLNELKWESHSSSFSHHARHLFHHLLALFKLFDKAVYHCNIYSCTFCNSMLTAWIQQLWIFSFCRCHGKNNCFHSRTIASILANCFSSTMDSMSPILAPIPGIMLKILPRPPILRICFILSK